MDDPGNWRWDSFSYLLLNHILLRIALIQPPSQNNGEDQVYWAESNNGSFMVKSAYNAISSYHSRNEDFSWDIVWRWKGPQSIRTFLWLVTHNRLKTKAELARKHILANAGCDRCGCGVEDTLHVLRDCMAAKRILPSFYSCGGTTIFLRSTFKRMALV